MKLFWEQSELELYFTLNTEEKKLLAKRTDTNKLGCAVLMKFVQYDRKFPTKKNEIPHLLIKYIAEQLDLSHELFKNYSFNLNSGEYRKQRAIIRRFYNIRKWNRKYVKNISKFIYQSVLPQKMEVKEIQNEILNFLYKNSIEPPSHKYLGRMIGSILNSWENAFFERIYSVLSSSRPSDNIAAFWGKMNLHYL